MNNYRFGKWLSNPPKGEEVVISGIAGKFPDSDHIHEFRDHLFNKEEMLSDNTSRWQANHPELPQRIGKIKTIDKCDAGYFGIHYRQAENMDPMMRIFLETVVESIMDAGVHPSMLEGSRTGVFIGACWSDVECEALSKMSEPQNQIVTGYLRSFIAHRVSYFLKLKGSACIVDTACSSSLNALEHAFKAIRTGQCDNAIVGGAAIDMHPAVTIQFFRLGVLSPDARCRAFDQNANGYVRAETIGSLFLQKAEHAKRIYSQVLYSKINCDGYKLEGITFPSSKMQSQLMNEVLEDSGIEPDDITYLEAHGTGTVIGDPEEVEAIDSSIARKRRKPLWVGSVKSNTGHTEPASGICSIAKIIIASETGFVPPQVNLNKIRDCMKGFHEGRMKPVLENLPIEEGQALFGINNFGFGGNNVQVLLRRLNTENNNPIQYTDDFSKIICVSGRTQEAVTGILNDVIKNDVNVEYVALLHHLFSKDFPGHNYRGYSIFSNERLVANCVQLYFQPTPLGIFFGSFEKYYKQVGQTLMKTRLFREKIRSINNIISPKYNNMVKEMLLIQNGNDRKTEFSAFAVQLGVADILKNLGITPNFLIGKSWGQLTCAYFDGSLNFQEVVSTAFEEIFLNDTLSKKDVHPIYPLREKYNDKHGPNERRNYILLDISNSQNGDINLICPKTNEVKFLEAIGSLYLHGYNPQLQKLYPAIEFPVSRGTPMISPLIEWNHEVTRNTYQFQSFETRDVQQMEFNFALLLDDKHLAGHMIDGRYLFPATGYLYLVWKLLAWTRRLLPNDIPVVFENVRFSKAVTFPASGFVKLFVAVQKGTGNFEVTAGNNVVVSGRAYIPDDTSNYLSNIPVTTLDGDDPAQALEEHEIYRELNLRGYNYSGIFKGILKCNLTATKGVIRWENEWVSFLDKMLQLKVLQINTRLLYVPTGIKKMVIDPSKFLEYLQKFEESSAVPIVLPENNNLIKTVGIEISGVRTTSIPVRKLPWEPVLEKNIFVPNECDLGLEESIRVITQIVIENSHESKVSAIELANYYGENDVELILPKMLNVLEDIPLISSDFIISSKTQTANIENIKIEAVALTQFSDLLLIVGWRMIQSPHLLKQVHDALSKKGFLLSREDKCFPAHKVNGFNIVNIHRTDTDTLVLLNKSSENIKRDSFVRLTSNHLSWLPQLQQCVKDSLNVIIYSQHESFSGILGFVNCLRRETGYEKFRCFFIMDDAPEFNPSHEFYREQIKKNLAINVYKNGKWGTYRHLQLEPRKEIDSEHCYVNVTKKGDLSSLKWIQGPLTLQSKLRENRILINSCFVALNFRDVVISSARIRPEMVTNNRILQECIIGFEFAGRDLSGRRFMGINDQRAFSTLIDVSEANLWEFPEQWTLAQAVTIPIVYSTVIYALLVRTKLTSRKTILIHSAAGGVGIAALNLALHYKCEVFVTVGTQEKRDFLRKHFPEIEESHIANSRDLSFEHMIKRQTNGRGVDVILNSLSCEKQEASIRCLARGGEFLEIGKFDIGKDTFLRLELMKRGASFCGIMLDSLFGNKLVMNQIYECIKDGIDAGYVKPLPVTTFDRNEIVDAFKYMATGKHVGKVIIRMRKEEDGEKFIPKQTLLKCTSAFCCKVESTYIIVGGLGGFGLELADWLMLRGAKKLLLVSRTGIKTGYQSYRIRFWKSYGISVTVSTSDVTTESGCTELISEAIKQGPVDGIFNLAAVLRDGQFENQTREDFEKSLLAKAVSTKYMDKTSRILCPELRYFVVFSSVSCGRGNAGQTNYGMANSVMERICEARKADGLPALAIQWGAIADVGLVAQMQKDNKILEIGGTLLQKVSNCLEVLDDLLERSDETIVSSMVVAEKRIKGFGSAVDAVANVLGIKDLKNINPQATLAELGSDSISATEITQLLEKEFGIYLEHKDIRSLTFQRITELEIQTKSEESGIEKTGLGENTFFKYLPKPTYYESSLTRLQSSIDEKSEGKTVFLLPGIECSLDIFERLFSNVNAHVLALLYKSKDMKCNVEGISQTLLPLIKQHSSKQQVVNLIGYSFGTIVATEIISSLEKEGFQINFIAIEGSPEYISKSVIKQFPSVNDNEHQTSIIYYALRSEEIRNHKEKITSFDSMDDRLNYCLSLCSSTPDDQKSLIRDAILSLYQRVKATIIYRFNHERIRCPVRLFKATHQIINDIVDDYGYSNVSQGLAEISIIEGDHVTILDNEDLHLEISKLI